MKQRLFYFIFTIFNLLLLSFSIDTYFETFLLVLVFYVQVITIFFLFLHKKINLLSALISTFFLGSLLYFCNFYILSIPTRMITYLIFGQISLLLGLDLYRSITSYESNQYEKKKIMGFIVLDESKCKDLKNIALALVILGLTFIGESLVEYFSSLNLSLMVKEILFNFSFWITF